MLTTRPPGATRNLLPEEDVIGDPDDDDEIDDLLPADLWFRRRRRPAFGGDRRHWRPCGGDSSRRLAQWR